MSVSKEEVDKTVTAFQKISSRDEKKSASSNSKLMLIVSIVVIAILLVIGYLYLQKNQKGKGSKPSRALEVSTGGVPQTNVQVQQPAPITV